VSNNEEKWFKQLVYVVEKRVVVIKNESMSSKPENNKKCFKLKTTWVGVSYELEQCQDARKPL